MGIKKLRTLSIGILIILILISFFTIFPKFYNNTLKIEKIKDKLNNDITKIPKTSSLIGIINLTNYQINNTDHYHGSIVPISGKIYAPFPPPPPYFNLSGYNVAISIDGSIDYGFSATSNAYGDFQINYQIPYSFSVFSSYKIEVECIDDLGDDFIIPDNFFIINLYPLARLNLTNYEIQGLYHPHGSTFSIEGKVYDYFNDLIGLSGHFVSLYIDGQLEPQFNDTTDGNGEFQIDYTVPYALDIYQVHTIEVNVTQLMLTNDLIIQNSFIFNTNATSIFEITTFESGLKTPGETFSIDGYLRYDNLLGDGIPNKQINYNWYNSSYIWPQHSFFTDSYGSFSENIRIPNDVTSQRINLNLSFAGEYLYIEKIEILINPDIKIFSDIICIWDIISKATEGTNLPIEGQIISRRNSSLLISNRSLRIYYDGNQIATVSTDENGFFSYEYELPAVVLINTTGILIPIQVQVINTGGVTISSNAFIINVTAAPANIPSGPGGFPPFFIFSIIFFPILGAILIGLTLYGYRYYKKQEKVSRVVVLPLESRIKNLKILKDTGRLEESISYLFNAIYMDLVNAKYGRSRKDNETIRDFAIISVKELKLTPATIYPFIQKVEEIIYARPFEITEKDFYNTCGLFSPIYFQLTGYNFVLSF